MKKPKKDDDEQCLCMQVTLRRLREFVVETTIENIKHAASIQHPHRMIDIQEVEKMVGAIIASIVYNCTDGLEDEMRMLKKLTMAAGMALKDHHQNEAAENMETAGNA